MTSKAPGARCNGCPLEQCTFVPAYFPEGANILVVGEAPGGMEAAQGVPFVGPSGRLLHAVFAQHGVDFSKVARTNVVACRPPGNATPDLESEERCRGRLRNEIRELPTDGRIAALGKEAAIALVPSFEAKHRGMWHFNEVLGRWVLPTWHPAYILRKPGEAETLVRDLGKVARGPTTHKKIAPKVVQVSTLQNLKAYLDKVPDGTWVALDIETSQTQWYDRPSKPKDIILMLQLCWNTAYGVVLDDVMLYDTPGVIECLNTFLSRVRVCAHNGKFDAVFLRNIGIHTRIDFDTMLAHYLLDENGAHGLKVLASQELDIPDYEEELISMYLNNRNDDYSKVPFDKFAEYGVLDVACTLTLREIFAARIEKQEGLGHALEMLTKAQNAFIELERTGIQLDTEYLAKVDSLFQKRMEFLIEQMRKLSGHPQLNPNSTQQMAAVLYDELRLPQPKNPRVGPRSTAHGAIEPLKGAHPLVDVLLYYRRVAKLRSSYIENMLEMHDLEGRAHPTVLLHGTETGRLAMRDPAMQTIPRPARPDVPGYDPFTDGAVIRGSVIAPPGYVLVIVDYSQAELRVLAALSQDPFLISVYKEGRDLHSEVARAMFGENYTKEQRVRCKMFNFSWVYGGNEYSFAQDQGLQLSVAQAFVREYNKIMSVAVAWKEEQDRKARSDGFVTTRFGRRRRFPLITDQNRDEVRKAAVNAPVQSSASDLTTTAATRLISRGFRVVHLVHDSIIVEARAEDAAMVAQQVQLEMERTGAEFFPEVPWRADIDKNEDGSFPTRWCEPPNWSLLEEKLTSNVDAMLL